MERRKLMTHAGQAIKRFAELEKLNVEPSETRKVLTLWIGVATMVALLFMIFG